MNYTDPTQSLPPLGQALAEVAPSAEQLAADAGPDTKAAPAADAQAAGLIQPAAEQPAPDAAPAASSSTAKVKAVIEEFLEAKGPGFKVLALPLLAGLNLPEDSSRLDAILVDVAQMVLDLRSDGAHGVVLAKAEVAAS